MGAGYSYGNICEVKLSTSVADPDNYDADSDNPQIWWWASMALPSASKAVFRIRVLFNNWDASTPQLVLQ